MKLPALALLAFAVAAPVDDEPPIRASFVAQSWFEQHVSNWRSFKFTQIKPPSWGAWTTGGVKGLASVFAGAGWVPAKVEHKAIIHCWRATPTDGSAGRNYLFAEGLQGQLLGTKSAKADKRDKTIMKLCGI